MSKWLIVLFLCCLPVFAKSQNCVNISKEDISGRWMDLKRINGDSIIEIAKQPDTYIFRDNMVFHKGEAADGIIVFNITGRYTVEDNRIIIFYKDYLKKDADKEDAKKMTFEVLYINEDKTEMEVLVQDYDYEYRMVLNKKITIIQ